MNKSGISPAAQRAICIGGMCSCAYLAVYIARNILGAVSPQMISEGVFTTEQVGSLSSIYFISYALGQLINGAVGDRIKAKYMISFGLAMAGVCNFVFSAGAESIACAYAAYAMTGFFLSMIYGPMTKVVSENTEPIYATRCSLGYTFASFFGTPMAGVMSAVLAWQGVFAASSAALLIMGGVCFTVFTMFERRGIVTYGKYAKQAENMSLHLLIKHRIIKFTLISVLTGVIRTSVVFWMPTYISQYLGFPADTAAGIFSAAAFIISMTAFLSVFIYEKVFKRNMDRTILFAFSSSAMSFIGVYLVAIPAVNIILLVAAIMFSNCAASMLWSRYCPSLRDTGMVSGVTGFLDFMSYMAAAASSSLFATAADDIGWGNLILIWFALMIFGVLIALPYKKKNA